MQNVEIYFRELYKAAIYSIVKNFVFHVYSFARKIELFALHCNFKHWFTKLTSLEFFIFSSLQKSLEIK